MEHSKPFYRTSSGLVRLQQLFQATNKYEKMLITIDTKRIASADNGYQLLRELHLLDSTVDHRVLLDVTTETAEEIILKLVIGLQIRNPCFIFAFLF